MNDGIELDGLASRFSSTVSAVWAAAALSNLHRSDEQILEAGSYRVWVSATESTRAKVIVKIIIVVV